tara:strand:+ start:1727 stop:1993 length:267 start_codon:yes stop_codon:yes gene_type:complete
VESKLPDWDCDTVFQDLSSRLRIFRELALRFDCLYEKPAERHKPLGFQLYGLHVMEICRVSITLALLLDALLTYGVQNYLLTELGPSQ